MIRTVLASLVAVALVATAPDASAQRKRAVADTPVAVPQAHEKAIYQSQLGPYEVTELLTGLATPWSLAFLPDGGMLITLRGGGLRRLNAAGTQLSTVTGVPAVWAQGQGGLLDVALSPDFANDNRIYLSYAEQDANGAVGTAVARAVLNGNTLSGVQVILRQVPKLQGSALHFGGRLAFAPDGRLFVTLGERGDLNRAQRVDMLQGKIARIEPDGTIPATNPFHAPRAQPAIWSTGHRNPQAAAIDPRTGKLWEAEHGPQGGDEINIPQSGRNYGWPVATYGNDYGTGQPYPQTYGRTAPGTEPPHYYWLQSPGVSGMAFYTDRPASAWNDNLFVGALAHARLIRLKLSGEQIVGEERLLGEIGRRIRDVRVGPDGNLYVLTDESNGRLLKIVPPAAP